MSRGVDENRRHGVVVVVLEGHPECVLVSLHVQDTQRYGHGSVKRQTTTEARHDSAQKRRPPALMEAYVHSKRSIPATSLRRPDEQSGTFPPTSVIRSTPVSRRARCTRSPGHPATTPQSRRPSAETPATQLVTAAASRASRRRIHPARS